MSLLNEIDKQIQSIDNALRNKDVEKAGSVALEVISRLRNVCDNPRSSEDEALSGIAVKSYLSQSSRDIRTGADLWGKWGKNQ